VKGIKRRTSPLAVVADGATDCSNVVRQALGNESAPRTKRETCRRSVQLKALNDVGVPGALCASDAELRESPLYAAQASV